MNELGEYLPFVAVVCFGLSALLWAYAKLGLIDEDLQRGTFDPNKKKEDD